MYKAIAKNKRNTWILLTGFSIMTVLLTMIFGIAAFELDPISSAILGTILAVVYSFISFYASRNVVLQTAGAKKVTKQQAFELYTLVENLSITAGIPMPEVYVINDESPNAFATGRDPEHAAVAVTTGLLKRLNKQELEGVLAHEIGHIKNYDIRIMTIVVVLVGLIVLLSDILLRARFFGNNNSKNNGQLGLILLIVGIVLGILSPLIAQVIKLAVSRTREYLADASGAMLTRHPRGLASALEKIAAAPPLQRANHATAHLYIGDPFKADTKKKVGFFSRLFSTHPPTDERIKRLLEM